MARKVTIDDRRAILPLIQQMLKSGVRESEEKYVDKIVLALCRRTGNLWINAPEDHVAAAKQMVVPLIERDNMERIVDTLKGK